MDGGDGVLHADLRGERVARAAELPSLTLPQSAVQGATIAAQVDPKDAASCSLVVRRTGYSQARRIDGGTPYVLQLRIAPRAARTQWRLAVRCDRTLSRWHRLKVGGPRTSSST